MSRLNFHRQMLPLNCRNQEDFRGVQNDVLVTYSMKSIMMMLNEFDIYPDRVTRKLLCNMKNAMMRHWTFPLRQHPVDIKK